MLTKVNTRIYGSDIMFISLNNLRNTSKYLKGRRILQNLEQIAQIRVLHYTEYDSISEGKKTYFELLDSGIFANFYFMK